MNPPKNVEIAYAAMDLCNPVSFEAIDRALGVGLFPPGARALDIGCGNAAMARHMAEVQGFIVEAVERAPAILEIAKARIAGCSGPGEVHLHHAEASSYLANSEPFDLVVCSGAAHVMPGCDTLPGLLAALARHVKPGGFILWADVFWRAPPAPELTAMMAGQLIGEGHMQNVDAGEAAGLACWYALETSRQDWDHYASSILAANQAWLDENPGHPEAPEVRGVTMGRLRAYLAGFREAFGFGVYLFRKPPKLSASDRI